jgi:response regulator RpfG family c-di-GMP phosphodiesterase
MNTASSTATILLVDDEPLVTNALERALHREPYEILTA